MGGHKGHAPDQHHSPVEHFPSRCTYYFFTVHEVHVLYLSFAVIPDLNLKQKVTEAHSLHSVMGATQR